MNLQIEIDNNADRILLFLLRTADNFIPSLAQRVDLGTYSVKLAGNAINIFLNTNEQDIAHGAIYLSNKHDAVVFLTSFGVDKLWWGRKIGERLMQEIEQISKVEGASAIRLEVDRSNLPAMRFYRRLGFETRDALIETNVMIKHLHDNKYC